MMKQTHVEPPRRLVAGETTVLSSGRDQPC